MIFFKYTYSLTQIQLHLPLLVELNWQISPAVYRGTHTHIHTRTHTHLRHHFFYLRWKGCQLDRRQQTNQKFNQSQGVVIRAYLTHRTWQACVSVGVCCWWVNTHTHTQMNKQKYAHAQHHTHKRCKYVCIILTHTPTPKAQHFALLKHWDFQLCLISIAEQQRDREGNKLFGSIRFHLTIQK